MLGADVDSDIPDRMKDGYGLNRNLIDRALEADVDTIVTCDNGIAAAEEIAYAKSMGMTIVVTMELRLWIRLLWQKNWD